MREVMYQPYITYVPELRSDRVSKLQCVVWCEIVACFSFLATDDIPKPTFPFSLLKKAEKPPPPVERTEAPPPTTNHSNAISTASSVATPAPPPKTANAQISMCCYFSD